MTSDLGHPKDTNRAVGSCEYFQCMARPHLQVTLQRLADALRGWVELIEVRITVFRHAGLTKLHTLFRSYLYPRAFQDPELHPECQIHENTCEEGLSPCRSVWKHLHIRTCVGSVQRQDAAAFQQVRSSDRRSLKLQFTVVALALPNANSTLQTLNRRKLGWDSHQVCSCQLRRPIVPSP